jgi:hypothetical protein
MDCWFVGDRDFMRAHFLELSIFTEIGAMDFPPYFYCYLPTATPFSNSLPLHSSKGQMGTIKGGRKIWVHPLFYGELGQQPTNSYARAYRPSSIGQQDNCPSIYFA